MPELPDLTVYIEALDQRIVGTKLNELKLVSPFLLRTAVSPIQDIVGRELLSMARLGKRLVLGFEDEYLPDFACDDCRSLALAQRVANGQIGALLGDLVVGSRDVVVDRSRYKKAGISRSCARKGRIGQTQSGRY